MTDNCISEISPAFGNDGQYIAFALSNSVRIFNKTDDTFKNYPIDSSGRNITSVTLSPNGKYVVCVLDKSDADNLVKVLNTGNDSLVELPVSGKVTSVSFAPNGSTLVIGCTTFDDKGNRAGAAFFWDFSYMDDTFFTNDHFRNPVSFFQSDEIFGVAAGLDDNSLATYQQTNITLWKRGAGMKFSPASYIPVNGNVTNMAFHPDGNQLIFAENPFGGEAGGTVETWNYKGQAETNKWFLPLIPNRIAYEPYSDQLVSLAEYNDTGENNRLSYWKDGIDSENSKLSTNFQAQEIKYFSDNLRQIVTVQDSLNIWNYSHLKNRIPFNKDSVLINKVTVSKDDKSVFWIQTDLKGQNGVGVLYQNLQNNYKQKLTIPLKEPISEMAFSPDGKDLVLLGEKGNISVLDIRKRTSKPYPFFNNIGRIQSFKISPEGHFISTINSYNDKITNEEKYSINIWNYRTGRKVAGVKNLSNVNLYTWSPDEKCILISTAEKFKMLQVEKNSILLDMDYRSMNGVLSFSSSGRYFGVGYDDGTVRVFETLSQKEVSNIKASGKVTGIAFNKDDRYFSTLTNSATFLDIGNELTNIISVWQLQPAGLIAEAKKRLSKMPKPD
ncbi:WD40 repeat domain-containing protein [Dyadobacter sp. NIV53]|uniref:WD40 repeat domain-containing protein n=1 Tax=Dyadobacter sp. NIV53 TaxID=2861765 RepID=UPI001C876994|nr:WD40 repeat domain-containing protein [Dyadobacter sp. NIV53]